MPKNKIIASEGTHLWAFNYFRISILSNLLDDLLIVEDAGLHEDHCKEIRLALGKLVNIATSLPDGSFFRASVYYHLNRFEEVYTTWNGVKGRGSEAIEQRRKHYRKLRNRRKKLSRAIRFNQFELQNDLDLQLMKDIYEAIGGVAKAVPDIFKNLAASYAEFLKRSAGKLT